MTRQIPFHPSAAMAARSIAAVDPAEYAGTRNMLTGAVSYLSPYITHGVVSLPQVVAGVVAHHPLTLRDKFVFELGWRAFFRHAWRQHGDAIVASLHEGPLPEQDYLTALPDDVRQGRTGVPAIDQAVRHLYAEGYLHNHARMWLASYLAHVRKVHWRCGADWLYAHLLDGDLASNHLSWQWVAGTGSSKPYLFNADNVEKFAPPAWHSRGSVIDIPYEAMEKLARNAQAACAPATVHAGVEEPALWNRPPPDEAWDVPDPALIKGRDVWLVHPWVLHDPPAQVPVGSVCVGVSISQFHQRWPWSAARWRFVGAAMAAVTEQRWHLDVDELACVLREAPSVQTVADPHIDALLDPLAERLPAPQLFPEVTCPCRSFSQWWKRAAQGIDALSELPGMLGCEA